MRPSDIVYHHIGRVQYQRSNSKGPISRGPISRGPNLRGSEIRGSEAHDTKNEYRISGEVKTLVVHVTDGVACNGVDVNHTSITGTCN